MKVKPLNFANFVDFVAKYRGTLYSFLLLAFFGLSCIGNFLNFSSHTLEIHDSAPISGVLAELTPLEKVKAPETSSALSETYSSSKLVALSRVATVSKTSAATFSISNPTPTSVLEISPNDRGVKIYGEKFLFAHSNFAFNGLKSLYIDNEFTVTRNGVTETYRVARREAGLPLSEIESKGGLLRSIFNNATYYGKTYDLALMTCGDGTYGVNGNNSAYRTFIFAYKV